MLKRVLIALAIVIVVGAGGFAALSWQRAIAPIAPPAAAGFAPDLVARGAVLAAAGYCASCHTARDGRPFAGGYAMATPFGTIYSTNITPDAETGIGAWSEAAFARAMRAGVARDGSHLFPAFPYDHFTKLTDDDVAALYAYFMTRAPVHAPAHANGLPFPLDLRFLQAAWKLLFFRPGRFAPEPARGPDWNRGAYLAEGISHCGACHTPRNLLGAEERSRAYAGAVIDNWVAPALTSDNPSPVPWSRDELFAYLRNGASRYHGTVAGPMAPVVHDGLSGLPDADIGALATYFAAVDDATARADQANAAIARVLDADGRDAGAHRDPDAPLYAAACAPCHYNGTGGPNPLRPELGLTSAVTLSDPTNLIHVILYGVGAHEGAIGYVMPGFAGALSDGDIARIAAYLRRTRTTGAPWPDLAARIAAIRAERNAAE